MQLAKISVPYENPLQKTMWSLLIFTFRKSTNSVLTLKNLVILPFSVEQCVGVPHPRKAACYNKPCLKLTACSISILLSSICSSIPSFTPSYGCIHSIISIVTNPKSLQLVKSHSNGKLGGNGDNQQHSYGLANTQFASFLVPIVIFTR